MLALNCGGTVNFTPHRTRGAARGPSRRESGQHEATPMSKQPWAAAATLGVLVLVYHNMSFIGDRRSTGATMSSSSALPGQSFGVGGQQDIMLAAPPSPPCAADGLLLASRHVAFPLASSSAKRYLLYAPQFGLSNQLVALRNAAAWAQLLNRTLVLPHLLAHGAVHPRAPFGEAFDVSRAQTQVAPLDVIDIDSFLRLGLMPAGVVALATTNKFRPADDTGYFDSLGVRWHRTEKGAPHTLSVPMVAQRTGDSAFSPAAIVREFGGCGQSHQVLAFRSLFAAFDPKPLSPTPPGWLVCGDGGKRLAAAGQGPRRTPCLGGVEWLDKVALPALLAPSAALEGVASKIAAQMTASDASAPRGRELACAHIRRGDFTDECVAYDIERSRRNPRPWVVSHYRNGWGCLQTESELALNLRAAEKQKSRLTGKPVAFYVSIEDPAALASMASLRHFNLSTLATFAPLLREARLPLPPTLAAILLDQLACAHASTLLLNAFSTFSQLVMGRIGLRHPLGHPSIELGWVRDLTKRQQARLGVNVAFWRREDSRVGRLV